MSTTPDLPGAPHTDPSHDDEVMFDELATRAGAALRRPAPADGVAVIAARRRHRQARKAILVGGIALATLTGALMIASNSRDAPQTPANSAPDTLTTATTVDSPPGTTVDSVPETVPATTVVAAGTTINRLDRNVVVDAYLSAVNDDRNCTHLECSFEIYLYPRWSLIQRRAAQIPGDDLAKYRDAISAAWTAWNDCVEQTTLLTECATQADAFEARFMELYDALNALAVPYQPN